ncbi:MAG: 3'(2'),5'-bisphosphate nucleotidase [Micavibrio aeruginosavorus]|uniref:3'(2'),5'-bisphosphate nucleotidase CysQ n=1 Tax=Micavibrio aeruginosavorus TaxID=349221 RepID=A0A2W5BGS5_9BACT|nr:MAG: 3'(2'),5'-bisphosphate nucleotidase [Micavibrio aeruginosavorus]
MSKLLTHLPALCNVVRRIAFETGELALDYFEEGAAFSPEYKADGSPVTEADRKCEIFIEEALASMMPDVPFVGEEAVSSGRIADVEGSEYFWLVDPLDGTRDFIVGSPDFTVNIALIKNGAPVLGVIYAPAHGEMYAAHGEGTAVRWLQETDNEKSIRVRKPQRSGLTVVSSKNRGIEEINRYLEEHKVSKIIRRASSLKICAIASGKADLYPGLSQTCEWDTAAGQAILEAAGGEIVTLDGKPLVYGRGRKDFVNPAFVARSKFLSETGE